MKKTVLSILCCLPFLAQAQTYNSFNDISNHSMVVQTGQAPASANFMPVAPEKSECITDADREQVRQRIAVNKAAIEKYRPGAFSKRGDHPLFILPVRAKAGFDEYGYYTVNFQVDHDPVPNNNLEDYNCAERTYDWATGNHEGTDYILWPYPWKRMQEEVMEIVAAAPGTIIDKRDGNFDLNCSNNGNPNWNGIILEHADGSQTWYWHFKNGAITTKEIGDTVTEGEYLGAAGSSGSSNWPHLHFEVYDTNSQLIDPYAGPCNDMNAQSWWQDQPDYFVPTINSISTHNTTQFDNTCGVVENTYETLDFEPGDELVIRVFYRDIEHLALTSFTILDPNGNTYAEWEWTQEWGQDYATADAFWTFNVTNAWPEGVYTLRAEFGGNTYEHIFGVGTNLGIEEAITTTIQLYPNPVTDQLFIEAEFPLEKISLYDSNGRKLKEEKEMTNASPLDVAGLSTGVYFLYIQSEGKVSVHKIIKN